MKPRISITRLLAVALVLTVSVTVPQYVHAQCVTPPSGMVAWWPLDEIAGSTANDIAGVNNAGTWVNSPIPVAGKVAGALSFSGSNSVDVPDHSELNFGTGDFSIDLWIKTTDASASASPILDKRSGSASDPTGYVLFLVSGCLGSQIADGDGYNNSVSTGFVADGNWHHVALTVDRDNPSGWLHYVDGAVVASANPTGQQGSLTNTAPLVLARNLISPSQVFAGTLDEVELFNRVLDPVEIQSLWAAGSAGKCKTTLGVVLGGNGCLTVNGTQSADSVLLRLNAAGDSVQIDNLQTPIFPDTAFQLAQVDSIHILTGVGDDWVVFGDYNGSIGTLLPCEVDVADGKNTVIGGTGSLTPAEVDDLPNTFTGLQQVFTAMSSITDSAVAVSQSSAELSATDGEAFRQTAENFLGDAQTLLIDSVNVLSAGANSDILPVLDQFLMETDSALQRMAELWDDDTLFGDTACTYLLECLQPLIDSVKADSIVNPPNEVRIESLVQRMEDCIDGYAIEADALQARDSVQSSASEADLGNAMSQLKQACDDYQTRVEALATIGSSLRTRANTELFDGGDTLLTKLDEIAQRSVDLERRCDSLSAAILAALGNMVQKADAPPTNAQQTPPSDCSFMTKHKYTGSGFIFGSAGDDDITGGPGTDIMLGFGGNDRMHGKAGIDFILGMGDADDMYGEDDMDLMLGGDGVDCMYGGDGIDVMCGNTGDDYMEGNDGPVITFSVWGVTISFKAGDFMFGDADNDELYGNEGLDFMWGNTGLDKLHGGDGIDFMWGNSDNDELWGEAGKGLKINSDTCPLGNFMWGNTGEDLMSGGVDIDLMWGNEGDDDIGGGDGTDLIFGNQGRDEINGDDGLDLLFGNQDPDNISGGDGTDVAFGNEGCDGIHGNDGFDILWGDEGDDKINGDGGIDVAFGNEGNDEIIGDGESDLLFGNDGNDVVSGGAGTDFLFGNLGDDEINGDGDLNLMWGNEGNDVVNGGGVTDIMWGNEDNDRMNGNIGTDVMWGNVGNDVLNGGDATDIMWGNEDNDTIYGGDATDVMWGNENDDWMDGGIGPDIMFGNGDNDFMFGGPEADWMNGNAGQDNMRGDDGTDIMFGNDNDDILSGDADSDLLFGNDGSDRIDGGEGTDIMFGNALGDFMFGGSGTDYMFGNGEADCMDGGPDDDIMFGNGGGDRMFGVGGTDLMFGNDQTDCMDGGTESDLMFGNGEWDEMYGRDGNETMFGNRGGDYMEGGNNNDWMWGNQGDDVMYGCDGSDWMWGNRDQTNGVVDQGNPSSPGSCSTCSGTVTIIKKTIDWNVGTFNYTGSLGDFSITTTGGTGSRTFSNVAPGTYVVTEQAQVSPWTFTSLICTDPDGGTTVNGQTATIDLDINETVVCTYTNTYKKKCVQPPLGMVAWWPLDETAGLTANDIAGFNNLGTRMNGPVSVGGMVRGALSFNGTSYVEVPDHVELNFCRNDFSIDLWIKTTGASGTHTVLDKREGTLSNLTGYALFLAGGCLGSQIADGDGYTNSLSTRFVADGHWHHIALTVDRDNPAGWLHYVDGAVVSTANPTAYQGSLTNTAPLVMAKNLITPSQTFAGTLDEIELFYRVLDPSEIHAIWAADSLGKCKDSSCCTEVGMGNVDGSSDGYVTMGDLTVMIDYLFISLTPLECPEAGNVDLSTDGLVTMGDLTVMIDNLFITLTPLQPCPSKSLSIPLMLLQPCE
jgi:Ca2+-binding RTX toxin-like protein